MKSSILFINNFLYLLATIHFTQASLSTATATAITSSSSSSSSSSCHVTEEARGCLDEFQLRKDSASYTTQNFLRRREEHLTLSVCASYCHNRGHSVTALRQNFCFCADLNQLDPTTENCMAPFYQIVCDNIYINPGDEDFDENDLDFFDDDDKEEEYEDVFEENYYQDEEDDNDDDEEDDDDEDEDEEDDEDDGDDEDDEMDTEEE
eukprot:CAMPEP_0202450686 /NCGR_PEP_ID=MMETSP1360-20130828/9266_1 /ASSEMBLY_ACC=CAM_ASM_000848 /TAXON_ID=515479 /ORGANISM="Licmophora paradoxa, Strain CCMP2313" /LENGTH=206 /DNA_ID=CAMNT_0049069049 /DNA_START=76 /DNA_END=696 /DNA_ORIENTATION=+